MNAVFKVLDNRIWLFLERYRVDEEELDGRLKRKWYPVNTPFLGLCIPVSNGFFSSSNRITTQNSFNTILVNY